MWIVALLCGNCKDCFHGSMLRLHLKMKGSIEEIRLVADYGLRGIYHLELALGSQTNYMASDEKQGKSSL